MTVSWPLLTLATLVVATVIAAAVWWRVRTGDGGPPTVVAAHTERLGALPGYQRAARRHRRWLAVGAGATVALVLAGGALAARPLRQAAVPPVLDNRDVLLCLDVSGSMVEYNRSILERFGELVTAFDGERIGMTIFNSSAVAAFPLTTDHGYVLDEFERFRQTFAERGITTLGGTLEGDGTSLVPDGIASCALGLPEDPAGRSRAMIVATDNIVAGAALVSMPEVTALLVARDITAYVLFPLFDFETERPGLREMRELASATGGQFFGTENPTAVSAIIDQVEAMEVARLDGAAREVRYVDSTRWILAAVAAAGVLVAAAGRVRR